MLELLEKQLFFFISFHFISFLFFFLAFEVDIFYPLYYPGERNVLIGKWTKYSEVRSQRSSFIFREKIIFWEAENKIVPYILFKNTVLNTSLSASYTT